jgi:hypothetical protein
MKNQDLHPCKTAAKTVVVYIFVFIFLGKKWEGKISEKYAM